MEWIYSLNAYAGFFSLLAVIAAIVVPYAIYKKGRRDERQAMRDELDAMNDTSRFPMDIDSRNYEIRKTVLEKGVKK